MSFEITPRAEKFIKLMLRVDGGPGAGFRLAVKPGGCSGLSSEIAVQATPDAGDAVIERNGFRLFLPAESRLLLEGVTVDFVDSPGKTGLVFHDPKGSTCSSHTPAFN